MDDGNTCSSSSEGESSSYNCDNAETGKVRSNILSLPVLNQILSKSKYSGWYIYISYQEENKVVSGWVRIRLCLTKVILNIVDPSNLQDAHIIPVHSRWLCLPFYLSIKHSWERVWPLKLWILGLDSVWLFSFLCPIPVPWYTLCYPKKVIRGGLPKSYEIWNPDKFWHIRYMYKDFVH